MLTMTENAATVVKTLLTDNVGVHPTGLRINSSDDPGEGFALSPVTAPEAEDSVVEAYGARIYLDPTAADALGDQILDAEVDAVGTVRFALAPQP